MRRALTLPVLLLAVAGCSGGGDDPTPSETASSIDGVQLYSGLSQKHLGKGGYDQSYPQSPPVGGAHSPVWLKCQVYTSLLPNVNAVHSLEHGGVWITYAPTLPAADVARLAELTGLNQEYVMVSPYDGQDSPVAVTAWGRQLKVSTATDPRIAEFVRTYAGKGPESRVTCRSSGATLEQAQQYDEQNK